MNDKIKSLIKSNYKNFPSWDYAFQNFVEVTYLDKKVDDNKHSEIIESAQNMFTDLARIFIQAGKYRENWLDLYFIPHPLGLNTIIKAKKIDCDFQFGVNEKGFYLETYISNPENIKYMSDDFWYNILKLTELGKFEYYDNFSLENVEAKETEKKLYGKKSHLFRFLRDYFILELYEEDLLNIGSFSISWLPNTNWDELINAGSQAFKIFYRINYSLWRASYLAKRK
ncbi:MAG: hypothetical protein WC209_08315 [Ignavibacteriaceae bacterium]|jgi:hypothetical protein